MLPHRRWLFLLSLLLVGGSLVATSGYAFHIHSDRYRRNIERDLHAFFELPTDIGRIRPLSFSSRLFEGVKVWLHDRRGPVFQCERAVWHEDTSREQPVHHLDLHRGTLSISSEQWKRDDYSRVLKSGLGHDFDAIRLGEVRLHDFGVEFRSRDLKVSCGKADGVITFGGDKGSDGVIRLSATELNGKQTGQPVQISARFSPSGGVSVHDVLLTVPDLPLSTLGIDAALQTKTTTGRFSGKLEFATETDAPNVSLSGRLSDIAMEEVTRFLEAGPVRGKLDIAVDRARIVDRVVTHLSGRGEIRSLQLGDISRLAGYPQITGRADLSIRAIDLALGHLNRLVADGRIRDVPLEAVTALVGKGEVTGRLAIRINSLRASDDRIEWADIEIEAVPPPGAEAGTIHRELLVNSLTKLLDFKWPSSIPQSLLPEHVEYARFGARLRIENNQLRVLGTHGPGGDTILTLRVFGAEVGVIKSLKREIDLTPRLDALRDQLSRQDPREIEQWWRERRGSPRPGAP